LLLSKRKREDAQRDRDTTAGIESNQTTVRAQGKTRKKDNNMDASHHGNGGDLHLCMYVFV